MRDDLADWPVYPVDSSFISGKGANVVEFLSCYDICNNQGAKGLMLERKSIMHQSAIKRNKGIALKTINILHVTALET